MKKIQSLMAVLIVILLAACSGDEETIPNQGSVNDGEAVNGYGAIDHGVDDKKVGFNLSGDTIEEASGVPAEEKEKILDVFNVYISSFNDKDIERYLDTLSDRTDSFDKAEERVYMTEEVFNHYDLNREASDVTIVKYSDTEAQVFSKLQTSMKQLTSGLETNPSGRQVTVFTKDEGDWKVASVHYIGDVE